MKGSVWILLTAALWCAGCSDAYDDSALTGRVEGLENRIEALEKLCKQMNTNIASLQTLLEAVQNRDYITAVTPIQEDGKTIGYTITFAKNAPITIYHGNDGKNGKDGHSPVIGAARDTDGIYYWTLDGKWLTDASGAKIRAEGSDGKNGEDGRPGEDGVTPQLKIENGFWFVSTDRGETWTQLGQATGDRGEPGQDSIFSDVTQNDAEVIFTLSDGTTITLPKISAAEPLDVVFSSTDIELLPENTYEIGYTISGADEKTTIEVVARNDYRAHVVETDFKSGKIVITTPATATDDRIIVLVSDGGERTVMRFINIIKSVITVTTDAYTIEQEGGTQTVEVTTNIDFEVYIDKADRDWIDQVTTRAPHRTESITFAFRPNPETSYRHATVELRDKKGRIGQSIFFTQKPWGYKTLHVETPGTLRDLIPDDEKERLLGLILSGTVDSLDLVFLRTMPALVSVDLARTDNTTLPAECFKESPLQTIVLPDNLRSIPDDAFYRSEITSVRIPTSVTSIGTSAFYDCWSLKGKLLLPEGLQRIGQGAFSGCKKLTGDLTIPDSVTEIGSSCFLSCEGFDGMLTLGSKLTAIPSMCFFGCKGLRGDLILPDAITNIGSSAFQNCTGFTGKLVLGRNLRYIDILVFCRSDAGYNYARLKFSKVYCKAPTPPICRTHAWGYDKYPYLAVPWNALTAYQDTAYYGWGNLFSTIEGYTFVD